MRVPITLCVVAMNEEDRIEACLASAPFADEIVVVDSHSMDRTRDVAAAAGARVLERDWDGHVGQKRFAVERATHDWVFLLDADERCTPELRAEIERAREAGFPGVAAFSMPRATIYLGRRIRHGGFRPQRKVRLFDRRRARIGGSDPHDRVEADGPVGRMRGAIDHVAYRTAEEHLRTIDRYTDIMAGELHRRGRRARAWDPPLHAASRFLSFYVWKAGFLEGALGLRLARLAARYAYLKYSKLRRLGSGSARRGQAPPGGSGSVSLPRERKGARPQRAEPDPPGGA